MKCIFCGEVEMIGKAEVCGGCAKRGLREGWLGADTSGGKT